MKSFHSLLRFLKKNLLIEQKIIVRRTRLSKGLDGDCTLIDNRFFIRICKTLPDYYAIEVLIHEVAHCLAWDESKDEKHTTEWGKSYSLVYRKFLEWLENYKE